MTSAAKRVAPTPSPVKPAAYATRPCVASAVERAEPRGRVDRAGPPVAEPEPVELRERREEVLGEEAVGLRARSSCSPAPDGRSGRPRRSRPTGCGGRRSAGSSGTGCRVADALPVRQPIERELLVGERLGHQHVVVDRHGEQPEPAERGAGRRWSPSATRAARTAPDGVRTVHGARRSAVGSGRGVCSTIRRRALGGTGQLLGELRRVDQGDVVVPAAGPPGTSGCRRPARTASGRGSRAGRLAESLDLVRLGRDVELAGALELAVEAVVGHRPLDPVEVLPTHPLERRRTRRATGSVRSPRRG